ncbi:MAG TPA: MerR family transcriptional regulator [Sphingomonas sp.]|nr:MerR family transcriptional regulator [Sphingomonas sp.]
MAAASDKDAGAFRTIGEVAGDTGLAQHVLRYWETRFPQLKPLQRAGNRRYYRPEDVALVRRIDRLINREGYTIRGVQQLLAREGRSAAALPTSAGSSPRLARLAAIRDLMARALADDRG